MVNKSLHENNTKQIEKKTGLPFEKQKKVSLLHSQKYWASSSAG